MEAKFFLKRYYKDNCTRGVLMFDPKILDEKSNFKPFFSYVLELKWDRNKKGSSCIREGTYELVKHENPKFKFDGYVRIDAVPGRKGIVIHEGNTLSDSRGCPLPGKKFGRSCQIQRSLPKVKEFTDLVYKLIDSGYIPTITIYNADKEDKD